MLSDTVVSDACDECCTLHDFTVDACLFVGWFVRIDGISYKRDIYVTLASFDEKLPFEAISSNP